MTGGTIICMGNFELPDLNAAAHRVVKRADGTASGEYYAKSVLFEGDPDGRNWRRLPQVFRLPRRGYSGTGLQEPGLVELPGGGLLAYFRTDRCFQYESLSFDGGARWSLPTQSPFTSPASPMLIVKNPFTGRYYAFWNPIPNYNGRLDPNARWVAAGRTPFVVAESVDGRRFSEYAVIGDDPERGYCYPAAFFTDEKTLLLSYCCGGPADGMCLTRTHIDRLTLA